MKRLLILLPVFMLLFGVSAAGAGSDAASAPTDPGTAAARTGTGDRVGIMQNIRIDSPGTGDVVAVLGDISVDSEVNGDVVSVLGNVAVNAGVNGDVISVVGTVALHDGVIINGDVIAVGGIAKGSGAVVRGQEIGLGFGDFGQSENTVQKLSRMLFIVLMFSGLTGLVLGMIFIAAGRLRFAVMAASLQQEFAKKFSVGILILIAVPFVFILSVITVVGPPLVLILAGLARFVGLIAFSIYFGRSIFSLFRIEMNIYIEYVTGMVALILINAVIFLMAPYTGVPGALTLYLLYAAFLHSASLGIVAATRFGSPKKGIPQMQDIPLEKEWQRNRYVEEFAEDEYGETVMSKGKQPDDVMNRSGLTVPDVGDSSHGKEGDAGEKK